MDRDRDRRGSAAVVWGWNGRGGLATGAVGMVRRPMRVQLPADVAQVALGTDFTIARTEGGEVWSWGGNTYGQLGDGTTTHRLSPSRIAIRGRVVAIAASLAHAAAVTSDGRLYAWGRNHWGQLGDGTTVDRPTPTAIALPGRVAAVSAGFDHTLATTDDGHRLYAWGHNRLGQLGDGTTSDRLTPTRATLPSSARIRRVRSGRDASAVLTHDGTVLVWGNSVVAGFGAAGGGQRAVTAPVAVEGLGRRGATHLAMGDRHVAVCTRGGGLVMWGRNNHGQLGDGTTTDRPVPVEVDLGRRSTVVAVASAGDHTLAATDRGALWRIGTSAVGAAGFRTNSVTVPERVDGVGSQFEALAVGQYAMAVIL